jgi:hypothetical protein
MARPKVCLSYAAPAALDPVGGNSARFDAAVSLCLEGATPSTSAPTARQITLAQQQESVKVPL